MARRARHNALPACNPHTEMAALADEPAAGASLVKRAWSGGPAEPRLTRGSLLVVPDIRFGLTFRRRQAFEAL